MTAAPPAPPGCARRRPGAAGRRARPGRRRRAAWRSPRPPHAPVMNKRYGIVAYGGVLSPFPPVAVVYLEGDFPQAASAGDGADGAEGPHVRAVDPAGAGRDQGRVPQPRRHLPQHLLLLAGEALRPRALPLGRAADPLGAVRRARARDPALRHPRAHAGAHPGARHPALRGERRRRAATGSTGLPAGRLILKAWLDSRTTLERPVLLAGRVDRFTPTSRDLTAPEPTSPGVASFRSEARPGDDAASSPAVATAGLLFAQHNVAANVRRDFQREFQGELAALHAVQEVRHAVLAERCRALARRPRIHAALEDGALDLLYPSARDELPGRDGQAAGRPRSRRTTPSTRRFYRFLDAKGRVISPPDAREAGELGPVRGGAARPGRASRTARRAATWRAAAAPAAEGSTRSSRCRSSPPRAARSSPPSSSASGRGAWAARPRASRAGSGWAGACTCRRSRTGPERAWRATAARAVAAADRTEGGERGERRRGAATSSSASG